MWKRIIKDFKKPFFVMFLAIVFSAGVELVKASVLGALTENLATILELKWIFVFIGFLVLQLVLSVSKDFAFNRLKRKIQHFFLRKGVGQYMVENEYAFSKHDMNEIMNKLTSEVEVINTQYIQSLLTVVSCMVNFVFATIYIGLLNVWFLIFLYVCSALMIVWNQSYKGKLSQKQEQIMTSKRNWISALQQFYQNFPVIKEYRLEKMEQKQLDLASKNWVDSDYQSNLIVDLLGSVNLEVGLIMFFGVYFICGLTARYTNVSIGILMAISQASNMITSPIIDFATLKNRMNASEPIVRSFYQNTEKTHHEKTVVSTIDQIEINLDELKENDKVLLQNIHLAFDRGKKYMITGPSGCGKTTLLKTLKGIYETDAVRVNGQNHVDYFDDASFVAQKGALFPWTIEKNIALDKEVVQEEIRAALSQVNLTQMDPRHVMRQDNETLSGGEMQRVHLARVIYQHKSWIFLDEAFSALDAQTTQTIERIFLEDPGITLIHVCHKPVKENVDLYDEIIQMEHGKVVGIQKNTEKSMRERNICFCTA